MRKIKNSEEGLTLLDVIVAVGILVVGLMATLGVFRAIVVASRFSTDRFLATNLAQEGVEIVRAIRDSNWKAIEAGETTRSWKEGFRNGGTFQVQYNTPLPPVSGSLPAASTNLLNIDSSNYYSYDAGTPTKFKRTITIANNDYVDEVCKGPAGECVAIISTVTWGSSYSVSIEDRLYNWRK